MEELKEKARTSTESKWIKHNHKQIAFDIFIE